MRIVHAQSNGEYCSHSSDWGNQLNLFQMMSLKHLAHPLNEDVWTAEKFLMDFKRSLLSFSVSFCQVWPFFLFSRRHPPCFWPANEYFCKFYQQMHMLIAQSVGQVANILKASQNGHFCKTKSAEHKNQKQQVYHVYL